jgi:hypothetical protein
MEFYALLAISIDISEGCTVYVKEQEVKHVCPSF